MKFYSPLTLAEVKKAAKRMQKSFPEKQHMELLDIATYALTGKSSYFELTKALENLLTERSGDDGRSITYGQFLDIKPSFRKGDWYFYPAEKAIVFDGEFSPYPIFLNQISTTGNFLDSVLQVQRKNWGEKIKEKYPNVSITYQVNEFISLVDDLCRYYFNDSIQGVFCPSGQIKEVDWNAAISRKEMELIES